MVSRRVALKYMGLSSTVVAAPGVLAHQHRSGHNRLPPDDISDVLQMANNYADDTASSRRPTGWWNRRTPSSNPRRNELNRKKYERIATDAWRAFNLGIDYFNMKYNPSPLMKPAPRLLSSIFETTSTDSGKKILDNLENFKDLKRHTAGPGGQTYSEFMVCAFKCGELAAGKQATLPGNHRNRIGVPAYEWAWAEVKARHQAMVLRKGYEGQAHIMGGGC